MSIDTSASDVPWARFDDLRANTALRFHSPGRVLLARHPDEVVDVLAEVERATNAGQWAFGYVAYEAASGLDPVLLTHGSQPDAMPLVWFGLCAAPSVITPVGSGPAPGAGYRIGWNPDWLPEQYHRDVERVQQRIAAGETYQCNFSVRMRGEVRGELLELYRDLALNQRGAHNAYLDLGRFVIASASPEMFFQRRGDELLLRPMKGTALRGRYLAEDRERAAALRSSEKERAENIMIVDLMRNDAARVALTGSVSVPALCTVERYETVLTLTSDVTARLRPDVGLVELFRTLFPSGSVTGAPKRATMSLITALEDTPRGVYCGAIGMVGPPGADVRAQFSVGIRTVVIDRAAGTAVYGTGGAITWSSDPAAEHAEVLAKAAVLDRPAEEFELLETMHHDPGSGLRNRDRHLRRLADSAEYLDFHFDVAAANAALDSGLAGAGAARVRLRLSRHGVMTVQRSSASPPRGRPIMLTVDDEPVDSASRWLYHKTTLREPYARRRRRHPEVDDVILVNEHGQLTELSTATLGVKLDGQWWTPPIETGCLPGIERGRLLEENRLRERVLWPADLTVAQDISAISSLYGRRPARMARTQAQTSG